MLDKRVGLLGHIAAYHQYKNGSHCHAYKLYHLVEAYIMKKELVPKWSLGAPQNVLGRGMKHGRQ